MSVVAPKKAVAVGGSTARTEAGVAVQGTGGDAQTVI